MRLFWSASPIRIPASQLHRPFCRARIHQSLSCHRATRFRTKLVIDYVPDEWLVESKVAEALISPLFRNHGAFPRRLYAADWQGSCRAFDAALVHRIGAYFYPRGGMPIDVFWAECRAARRRLGAA